MENLKDVLDRTTPKGVVSYFRHNPEKLVEFRKMFHFIDGTETVSELFYLYKINATSKPTCICGQPLTFVKFSKGYTKTCKNKNCIHIIGLEKRKKTNVERFGSTTPAGNPEIVKKIFNTIHERYGVSNTYDIPGVKEKTKETNLNRYGKEWSAQNTDVEKKRHNTMIERYGTIHHLQNPELRSRAEETNLKRYGTTCVLSSEEIRERIKTTNIDKYGHDNPSKSPQVKEKIKKTNLLKYGEEVASKNEQIKNKIGISNRDNFISKMKGHDEVKLMDFLPNRYLFECRVTGDQFVLTKPIFTRRNRNGEILNPRFNPLHQPKQQQELHDFIRSIYSGRIIDNDDMILNGQHIDILLPDSSIGIEYNGIYWHSELYKDKNYHLEKWNKSRSSGISLIHIFEDEWNEKKDIVKSIISNRLGKTTNRIYARKCEIKEVDSSTANQFLTENHIQGQVNSKIRLGLFYNNQLVSLMTFGKNRLVTGHKSSKQSYELLRFCNRLDHSVVGGPGKLFKFFLEKYNPQQVLSFSDKRLFDGQIYEKIGFEHVGDTKPSYSYVVGRRREHRFKYRKSELIKAGFDPDKTEHQIMRERGIPRIYDCGNRKYIWKIPS